jgi:long-chain acyl-CoA synthetase
LARALDELGIGRGERVLLLSDNRPEWHIFDLAVLDIGAVDVPVYGTLTPEQIAYQVNDSGAVAAVVDTPEQMAKLIEIRGQCPQLQQLIQIEGDTDDGVVSYEDLLKAHDQPGNGDAFWDRAAKIDEYDLMTIIYTSGTTGDPKGVMLSHGNVFETVKMIVEPFDLRPSDSGLSYLPLAHIAEQMMTVHMPAYLGVTIGDAVRHLRGMMDQGEWMPHDELPFNWDDLQRWFEGQPHLDDDGNL